jgi:hypothetical protein
MEKEINQFDTATGAERLGSPKYVVFLLVISAMSIWVITHLGVGGALALITFPFLLLYFYWLFRKPITGLWAAIIMGFLLLGIARYIDSDLQIGIGMDIILILTYVAFIFRHFYDKKIWKPARKEVTLLAAIWLGYSILEFFNPEARSYAAWFSGMRGISLYMMLIVPLVLLFIDNVKKLDLLFTIWGILSILASLKGIMQITIGPDPWEQLWLSTSAGKTHIIWGQLRAFSFMTVWCKPGIFCGHGPHRCFCRKEKGQEMVLYRGSCSWSYRNVTIRNTWSHQHSVGRVRILFHSAEERDRIDFRNPATRACVRVF